MAALDSRGIGRAAVLCPVRLGPTPAEVVCEHRPSLGQGSVLSLRGQQPGKHARPARLSGGHRAEFAPEGDRLAVAGYAKRALGDRLRSLRGVHRGLRLGCLASPRSDAAT